MKNLSGDEEPAISSRDENFHIDLEFEVMDYMSLPEFGEGYFSLTDAALLAALDAWWLDHGEDDDPDFDELIANPQARKAAGPHQKEILKALLRSISLRELDARIFSRELSNSEPVPNRTYAHIGDIESCLEKYGLGHGHLIQSAKDLDDDLYDIASSIARRRAAIRIGISPSHEEIPSGGDPHEVIEHLQRDLRAKKLQIAYLESTLRKVDGRHMGSRQRQNLYRTVGALLHFVLPRYKGKQEALIADIETTYPKREGLSKRTLESVFPAAKKALESE